MRECMCVNFEIKNENEEKLKIGERGNSEWKESERNKEKVG